MQVWLYWCQSAMDKEATLERVILRAPSPHARSDALLFLADRVGIDRRGGELGVAEPLLHQVQRDAGRDRGDAEAVAQPLGRGVGPSSPPASMTACTARQP